MALPHAPDEPPRTRVRPSRTGLLFLGLVLLMLMGAVNYGSNMGFFFTFLLAGLAMVDFAMTRNNLAGLEVVEALAPGGFAGDKLQLEVTLTGRPDRQYEDIGLAVDGGPISQVDPFQPPRRVVAPLAGLPRGRHRLRTLAITSGFPLGLFVGHRHWPLHAEYLVYPHPSGNRPLDCAGGSGENPGAQDDGQTEFAGIRRYVPGDTPSRIAWKAVARSGELASKAFASTDESTACWLAWEATTGPTEARLSQLAQWVLTCESGPRPYGLRLPGTTIPPGHGHRHRHRCLAALAEFRGGRA